MDKDTASKTLGDLTAPRRHQSRGRWQTVLLTLVLLGGLLAVLSTVFRDRLRPSVAVQVGSVLLLEEDGGTVSGQGAQASELLFQASGWIEPDPWPLRVAVLTDGFVQAVWVKEGETVTNGQLIARLDPADATLEWREAQAREAAAQAAVAAASNQLHAASTRQEAALARVDGAAAWMAEAQDVWRRFSSLSAREVAETRLIAARRALGVSETELVAAKAGAAGAAALLAAAESQIQTRKADLAAARRRLEMAILALERTRVRAPANGIVLRRYVEPGSKRIAAMDDPDSATIISMFDPNHLQVRVDVPLAEAGRLAVGMPTRISTAMLPGQTFTGEVTRIVGQADLQRNTLQVKVVIKVPSVRMRPEVLCRVEFWGAGGKAFAEDGGPASGRHALWVPVAAVPEGDGPEQEVWVVHPVSHEVERRAVRVGPRRRDGYLIVREGLRANEMVVIGGGASLKAGRRARWQSDGGPK